MLFKKKGIPDATVLRVVARILKNNHQGFKVKTSQGIKTLTPEEIIRFVEALAARLDDGRYGVIRRCDTCGNFSRSGKASQRGWCSPKERTLFKHKNEYCSNWIPMTAEQKHIKERIDEHHKSLQTK